MSSVLNRDTRQFGKKHMFDENNETCWNSDQVKSIYIYIYIPIQQLKVINFLFIQRDLLSMC